MSAVTVAEHENFLWIHTFLVALKFELKRLILKMSLFPLVGHNDVVKARFISSLRDEYKLEVMKYNNCWANSIHAQARQWPSFMGF